MHSVIHVKQQIFFELWVISKKRKYMTSWWSTKNVCAKYYFIYTNITDFTGGVLCAPPRQPF